MKTNTLSKENVGFYQELKKFENFDFDEYFDLVTDEMVLESIHREKRDKYDFLNLLSKRAKNHLETMAVKSKELTEQWFGRTISLYLPIYISNYCSNECTYCGFNKKNKISRKHLEIYEIEKEAIAIAKTGIKHILLLTGEAEKLVSLEYLGDAVEVLKKHFSSVSIEIYPMEVNQYEFLKKKGVDGLTIYQETYDKKRYKEVHLSGKKSNYYFRLNTPERGAKANLRAVNIGALFGLANLQKEAFFSGIHAEYLMNGYLNTEFSVSLPRINSAEGNFKTNYQLDDSTFVQFLLAYRLFLPRLGINISTRERADFRDNLLNLGVTKFSGGSKTAVGGYTKEDKSTEQFEISDKRSIEEIVAMIKSKEYQVIYKDWEQIS